MAPNGLTKGLDNTLCLEWLRVVPTLLITYTKSFMNKTELPMAFHGLNSCKISSTLHIYNL